MENDEIGADSLEAELHEAERAAATPFVHYPVSPTWYPPATGLWMAGLVICLFASLYRLWWGPIGLVALIGLELWFFRWYQRTWGALSGFTMGVVVTAALTFVLGTALIYLYEKRYAVAAQAVRDRLGMAGA